MVEPSPPPPILERMEKATTATATTMNERFQKKGFEWGVVSHQDGLLRGIWLYYCGAFMLITGQHCTTVANLCWLQVNTVLLLHIYVDYRSALYYCYVFMLITGQHCTTVTYIYVDYRSTLYYCYIFMLITGQHYTTVTYLCWLQVKTVLLLHIYVDYRSRLYYCYIFMLITDQHCTAVTYLYWLQVSTIFL